MTGPQEHDDERQLPDDSRLGARLWYLLMLIRREDAELRGGGRAAASFRGQGRVLRLLALHSPVAQKELGYLLGIRSQSLAEQIGKLEEAGLVAREPDPQDGRTSLVRLTDAGREAVETVREAPGSDPFAVLEEDERQQLAGLLDRVIAAMEAAMPGGPDSRLRMFREMAFSDDGAHPGHGGFGGFGGFGGRFRGGFRSFRHGFRGHGSHGAGPCRHGSRRGPDPEGWDGR